MTILDIRRRNKVKAIVTRLIDGHCLLKVYDDARSGYPVKRRLKFVVLMGRTEILKRVMRANSKFHVDGIPAKAYYCDKTENLCVRIYNVLCPKVERNVPRLGHPKYLPSPKATKRVVAKKKEKSLFPTEKTVVLKMAHEYPDMLPQLKKAYPQFFKWEPVSIDSFACDIKTHSDAGAKVAFIGQALAPPGLMNKCLFLGKDIKWELSTYQDRQILIQVDPSK